MINLSDLESVSAEMDILSSINEGNSLWRRFISESLLNSLLGVTRIGSLPKIVCQVHWVKGVYLNSVWSQGSRCLMVPQPQNYPNLNVSILYGYNLTQQVSTPYLLLLDRQVLWPSKFYAPLWERGLIFSGNERYRQGYEDDTRQPCGEPGR